MSQPQSAAPDASDLIWVCRRLAASLQGNHSVLAALEAISERAPSRARRLVRAMRQAVESGQRMGQALMSQGVPAFVGGVVWAGEAGSRLGAGLAALAEELEVEQALPAPRDARLHSYGLAFSRVALMLTQGVPVLEAFAAAADSAPEPAVQEALRAVSQEIGRGVPIWQSLPEVVGDLPPMVIEIVAEGEEAGRPAHALVVAADYLFDEAGKKEEEDA